MEASFPKAGKAMFEALKSFLKAPKISSEDDIWWSSFQGVGEHHCKGMLKFLGIF